MGQADEFIDDAKHMAKSYNATRQEIIDQIEAFGADVLAKQSEMVLQGLAANPDFFKNLTP